jgi:hypothetical protein
VCDNVAKSDAALGASVSASVSSGGTSTSLGVSSRSTLTRTRSPGPTSKAAGEEALAERAERHEPDAEFGADAEDVVFGAAPPQ